MPAEEKRRAPRARHDSVLELFDRSGHLITGIGRLVNLSTVGACFASTQRLTRGERVQGRLRLLKEGVLQITGQVVWGRRKTNTWHYGIEFLTVRRLPR